MKKALFRTMLLAFLFLFPVPSMAGVDVGVSISLPPLVVFSAPPAMVVIPETYVYVVPDADVGDLFLRWLVVASVGRALVPVTPL